MTRKQRLQRDASQRQPAENIEAWATRISAEHEAQRRAIAAVAGPPASNVTSLRPPQLIITLTPQRDGLQAELPGINGSRRVVRFEEPREFHTACLRMLLAQGQGQVEIGLDGAPTQAQVAHWQHSAAKPRQTCKFCLAAGWRAQGRSQRRSSAAAAGDGSVKVKRLTRSSAGAKRKLVLRVVGSLEDLGL